MQQVFEALKTELRNDSDFWTVTIFDGDDGIVWRNPAYIKHRIKRGTAGILPASELPLELVRTYLSPTDWNRMKNALRVSFETKKPVLFATKIGATSRPHLNSVTMLAVSGDMDAGIFISHQSLALAV